MSTACWLSARSRVELSLSAADVSEPLYRRGPSRPFPTSARRPPVRGRPATRCYDRRLMRTLVDGRGPTTTRRRASARRSDRPQSSRHGVAPVVVGAVVVAGVVLRFVQRSPLWLDEALSVNIARLPLGDLLEALRHDGHPPLYYLLLHGWMEVVGEGDVAVRALSGVFAVATLPLAWIAGRRLAGRPAPAGRW